MVTEFHHHHPESGSPIGGGNLNRNIDSNHHFGNNGKYY